MCEAGVSKKVRTFGYCCTRVQWAHVVFRSRLGRPKRCSTRWYARIRVDVGWCRRGSVSIRSKRNIFQYPRLSVPVSRERELGLTSGLKCYSNGFALAVTFQTASQTDSAFPRYRYRKSRILKNVIFTMTTDRPPPAPTRL